MTIGYKILFNINLLHEYCSDWLSKELELVPSTETIEILKNYQLIYRPTSNGLIVLARITDADGTLLAPIPETDRFKLVFYLKPLSPYFYNRTDLPIEVATLDSISPVRVGYYFDNLVANTFKPAGYPGSETSLKILSSKADSAVSEEDQLFFIPSIFKVQFASPTSSFTLQVKNKDGSTAIPLISISMGESFSEYAIDLSKKIAADYYLLSIDGGADQAVYIADDIFHKAPFGIVEIYQNASVAATNKFIKGTGGIQVKEGAQYSLWFRHRSLNWRFVFGADLIDSDTMTMTGQTFIKTTNSFESEDPIDLKDAYSSISMSRNLEDVNVPNPDGRIIKKAKDSDDIDYFFAEVHL